MVKPEEKSIDDLVADVQSACQNVSEEHAPTVRTIARFAVLLGALSKQSKQSADRLEWYTIALLIFGGATLGLVGLQVYFMFHPPK